MPDNIIQITEASRGPRGLRGLSGPVGPAAGPVAWSPVVASASWLIPHNLGHRPVVNVLDSAGETIGCKVEHMDINTLLISFRSATGGTALLL